MTRVRRIADFQFGRGAGEALFPDEVTFSYSNTKRVRYVNLGKERLVTVRANDGRFTLGYPGAKRLHEFLKKPENRVVVMEEAVPFIADGKNAMAKHVISADENILAEDEVFVVGHLLELNHIIFVGVVSFSFGYVWVEILAPIYDVSHHAEIWTLPFGVAVKIFDCVEPNVVVRDDESCSC